MLKLVELAQPGLFTSEMTNKEVLYDLTCPNSAVYKTLVESVCD